MEKIRKGCKGTPLPAACYLYQCL